jgi:hypothetical protein
LVFDLLLLGQFGPPLQQLAFPVLADRLPVVLSLDPLPLGQQFLGQLYRWLELAFLD